jgi:hypothetical protein
LRICKRERHEQVHLCIVPDPHSNVVTSLFHPGGAHRLLERGFLADWRDDGQGGVLRVWGDRNANGVAAQIHRLCPYKYDAIGVLA